MAKKKAKAKYKRPSGWKKPVVRIKVGLKKKKASSDHADDFSLLQRSATTSILRRFAKLMMDEQKKIGFRVSNRGWYYVLEQQGMVHHDMREKLRSWINRCRKLGYLPMDFVADEAARQFFNVEVPSRLSPKEFVLRRLDTLLEGYGVDWWKGEEFYVQVVVNNVDLVGLFRPVCAQYHIPIANTRGWSSTTQRASYARRFKAMEARGLKCVLLVCSDLDPQGVWMSELMHQHMKAVSNCLWSDGTTGYDPSNLKIYRFGINYDFVEAHQLPWVENLTSATGRNLAKGGDAYVRDFIAKYGNRKVEASCLVGRPALGQALCRDAIEAVIGRDALSRFAARRTEVLSTLPSSPSYLARHNELKCVIEKEMK